MSAANAAGILRYCRESDLISGESAALLFGTVSHTDQTSIDYIVGSSGQILGDAGKNFSISRAPIDQQSQACQMVVERAKALIRQH